MNFRESEAYLLSLGNEVSAMKLGLESIRRVLAALGSPQTKYLKVQVAGTNGKGSVCAFLDAICRSAGIRTGLYTSPHLISITERIKIDGQNISEPDFARHATAVREISERLAVAGELGYVPTFFEQVTATALTAFADAGVELAVLETGLGGRLDATTAAGAEIAVITPIALDHQEILGDSIEKIAAEKAAIIHRGSNAVIGEQDSQAMAVILDACRRAGVEPLLAETVEAIERDDRPGVISRIDLISPSARYDNIKLSLPGRHQIANAKTAVRGAEELGKYFRISNADIVRGLETASHPGRLEFQGRYLFDGAHNIAGAEALRSFLDEFVARPITMVLGTMREKDAAGILRLLLTKADRLVLTRPDNTRAISAKDLAAFVPDTMAKDRLFITKDVREAIETAERITGAGGTICVTGSLYLVGEVKKLLRDKELSI